MILTAALPLATSKASTALMLFADRYFTEYKLYCLEKTYLLAL